MFLKICEPVFKRYAERFVVILGDRLVINFSCFGGKRFFVFYLDLYRIACRNASERGNCRLRVKVFRFGIDLSVLREERIDRCKCVGVLFRFSVVRFSAYTEHEPAVAEQSVVRPVRRPRAGSDHRDQVYEEHNYGEYRKTEPAVRDDLIDLIRCSEVALVFLFVA